MNKTEKKFIADEIRDIAFQISNNMLSPEGAASKLYQLANELREELKKDSQK